MRATELEEVCLKLLEFGADPNKTTTVRKQTALHAAAQNGSSQVIHLFMFKTPNFYREASDRLAEH